jgi:hypothetical protein
MEEQPSPWNLNPLDRLARLEHGVERLTERGDRRHEDNQQKLDSLGRETRTQLEAMRLGIAEIRGELKGYKETLDGIKLAARWLAVLIATAIIGLVLKSIMPGLSVHAQPASSPPIASK